MTDHIGNDRDIVELLIEYGKPIIGGFTVTNLSCAYCKEDDRMSILKNTEAYKVHEWLEYHKDCKNKLELIKLNIHIY